jgi:hypothetical protein
VLIGLDTVSIGEPSARLADPSFGPLHNRLEVGNFSDRVWGEFRDPYQPGPKDRPALHRRRNRGRLQRRSGEDALNDELMAKVCEAGHGVPMAMGVLGSAAGQPRPAEGLAFRRWPHVRQSDRAPLPQSGGGARADRAALRAEGARCWPLCPLEFERQRFGTPNGISFKPVPRSAKRARPLGLTRDIGRLRSTKWRSARHP